VDKRIIRPLYVTASRDGVFHIVIRQFVGKTRECVFNLARVKFCLVFKSSGQGLRPAQPLFNGYRGLFYCRQSGAGGEV